MHIALYLSALRADLFPQGSCSHRMQIRLFLLSHCLSLRSLCCCQQMLRLIFSLPYRVSLCSLFQCSLQTSLQVCLLFHRQMLCFSAFHCHRMVHDTHSLYYMIRLSSLVSMHSAGLRSFRKPMLPASANLTAALCSSGCCSHRMHILLSLLSFQGNLSSLN